MNKKYLEKTTRLAIIKAYAGKITHEPSTSWQFYCVSTAKQLRALNIATLKQPIKLKCQEEQKACMII